MLGRAQYCEIPAGGEYCVEGRGVGREEGVDKKERGGRCIRERKKRG